MYKVEWRKEIIGIFILIALILTPVFLYNALPNQMPTHWNIHGHVDKFAQKSFLSVFLLPILIWAVYFLMLLLPFTDPYKGKYGTFIRSYRIIRYVITVILSLIYGYTIIYSMGIPFPAEKAIPGIIGLMFILLGNLLGKVRRNWFVGLRFPWAISDENNWNKTHRFGGKLFVVSGLLSLISLLLPAVFTFGVLVGSILISVLISAAYSYLLFKRSTFKN